MCSGHIPKQAKFNPSSKLLLNEPTVGESPWKSTYENGDPLFPHKYFPSMSDFMYKGKWGDFIFIEGRIPLPEGNYYHCPTCDGYATDFQRKVLCIRNIATSVEIDLNKPFDKNATAGVSSCPSCGGVGYVDWLRIATI